MRPVVLLILAAIYFYACDSTGENTFRNESDNNALQLTIDSLRTEIAEITRVPEDLIRDIKNEIKNNELGKAKKSLIAITTHQFSIAQRNEINKLLYTVNNLLQQNDFLNLPESDTLALTSFIKNYPKSKYSGIVRRKIKKLRQVKLVNSSDNSGLTKTYRKKINVSKSYETTRVGAICCDGTRSYATGRGACSHHGGVCQWLYR